MKQIKKFLSKLTIAVTMGAALVTGSVVYAAANIPVACSTPGDCAELDATFLNLTTQTVVRFLDADASHGVELQSPAAITADVTFTLPAEDGQAGQTLRTDGAGNLAFDNVSKRVGEMIFATTDASKTAANGYLAVSPGTITGGATDYPVWAAMYPEFVSGNDIVFPTNVGGMFLRNLGGNATTEGTFQNDATAINGLRIRTEVVYSGQSSEETNTVAMGTVGGNVSQALRDAPLSGDTETRPFNYAYQLYTIVDTY